MVGDSHLTYRESPKGARRFRGELCDRRLNRREFKLSMDRAEPAVAAWPAPNGNGDATDSLALRIDHRVIKFRDLIARFVDVMADERPPAAIRGAIRA